MRPGIRSGTVQFRATSLNRRVAAAVRRPLSVLVFDIDNFRLRNNRPGERRLRLATLTGALALVIGSAAQAMPPELGESVQNIQGANDISGWSHIDNQHVVMHVNEKNSYLLTLKHQCHGLA